jgi:serine/threonine protein kinase
VPEQRRQTAPRPLTAAPPPAHSGDEIDGFTLGACSHVGQMSTLFRVTKAGIDRPLVMKLPRLGPDAPSESLLAFETEAAIAPGLQGPHVPAFVAAGELPARPYLVTEWIEGRCLEQLLGAGPLPCAEVVRIGAALADALHSLHQQGVLHLDLKPDNVILREAGTAVLIDFGFAHRAGQPDLLAEETRFGVGSAPYVSPEQLMGSREDRRSDLFALGVVLYELTTGELPFGEPDTDVRNRLWLDPEPPSGLVREVPPWLQEIILRCLEVRADHRYQSAAHVAFDLRHPDQVALTARSTKARRASFVSQLQRFLRARAEQRGAPRSPTTQLAATPIVLVAVDTSHPTDARQGAIRFAVSQILSLSQEFRLICLTVIESPHLALEHRLKLQEWAAPFALPKQRLSLHAIASSSPADVIVELARYNNVDLVVLGAPAQGGRAWSQSVASAVTPRVECSVHVVRVPKR